MNIMINASTLNAGGGLQVADSICRLLNEYPQHQFFVVLPSMMQKTVDDVNMYHNVKAIIYDMGKSLRLLMTGRDSKMDKLVKDENIDAVLTVFGPSRWRPKCKHLSGFARAQMLFFDSPYFSRMSRKEYLLTRMKLKLQEYSFYFSAKHFWTENPMVSKRVETLFRGSKVTTVSNYYNQVFDDESKWKEKTLPHFEGFTILTVSANYPHKNLDIIPEIVSILCKEHPDFKFRFIISVDDKDLHNLTIEQKECIVFIGKVTIEECPSLYNQSDLMFLPTLLECFTASYPEAMKMEVPILTTKLEFAEGLCEDAALYFSPVSAEDAANQIYRLATDKALRDNLVEKGKKQLQKFDNHHQRTEKLIKIIESL